MTPAEILEEVRKSNGVIQPTEGDVHVNRPLTNISVAYLQSADSFIATKIFPEIPVMKKSDIYYHYPRDAWNRDDMEERRPGTESAGTTYEVSDSPYYTKVFALHKDVHDEARANQDQPINLDAEATRFLTQKSLLQKEIRFCDNYLKSSVWTFSADGASSDSSTLDFETDANNNLTYWSSDSSTPIEDVRLMKQAVQKRTSFRPNVLAISRPVYDVLIEHDDIIGRLNRGQTTGPAQANRDDLMRLFEVEDLQIFDAIYNSAKDGATESNDFIAGKKGILLYRPPSPGLYTPSAGYTFSWRGFIGAGARGVRIKRFRMEHLESDRVEIGAAYDYKKIGADLAVFLNNIVQ